jgi:hypothetical protein
MKPILMSWEDVRGVDVLDVVWSVGTLDVRLNTALSRQAGFGELLYSVAHPYVHSLAHLNRCL